MADGLLTAPRPSGWLRRLARFPIWLYRLRLGWLFGDRMLLLTHIGRTSGRLRQVVLEVIQHDRTTDIYIIASGYGERADWFRNVQQHPHVLIDVGTRRIEATAARLDYDHAAAAYAAYARRHPLAFRALAPIVVGQNRHSTASACQMLATRVPMVALQPLPKR